MRSFADRYIRKSIFLCMGIILLCVLFEGYNTYNSLFPLNGNSQQQLSLSLDPNDTGIFNTYCVETPNSNEILVNFLNLDNVLISINEHSLDLTTALDNQDISIDEISARARIDSRNGYCDETYRIQNGLTEFIYTYPDFEFCIIYDVVDYSSGSQKIENYLFCRPGDHKNVTHSFGNENGQKPISNNHEIIFYVEESRPTDIKIKYELPPNNQSNILEVNYYTILQVSDNIFLSPISESIMENIALTIKNYQNGFHIDWKDIYGSLPKGDYKLIFQANEVVNSKIINTNNYSHQFTIY